MRSPLPATVAERADGNIVEISVSELSGALKRTIEDRFGLVRVRGEISNFRGQHGSGHAYFCLKDESARIDAVIWKTTFRGLKIKPQEGLEVIATGRVTTFPGKSSYQIIIDSIEPAGLGALMALLEQRRLALAGEGLFSNERKRALPFLPSCIGIVTSPTGAVIRDILHRLNDRFPRHVLLWPVRVQGDTAAEEVAAAIDGFNALPLDGTNAIPARPDILIVARGGGSLEDLWAFNEEIVVRAAAASTIPLISAIGHETDSSLLDLVADLRAPTPTAAAEKAVPVRDELVAAIAVLAGRHRSASRRLADRQRADLKAVTRSLPEGAQIVARAQQALDGLSGRGMSASQASFDRRHLDLSRLANRLAQQAPRTRLAQRRSALGSTEQRLMFCVERLAERNKHRVVTAGQKLEASSRVLLRNLGSRRDQIQRSQTMLDQNALRYLASQAEKGDNFARLLETLGYRNVLARGFALVRDQAGRPLRSAQSAPPATRLEIEFADGNLDAITTGSRPPRRSRIRAPLDQASLF